MVKIYNITIKKLEKVQRNNRKSSQEAITEEKNGVITTGRRTRSILGGAKYHWMEKLGERACNIKSQRETSDTFLTLRKRRWIPPTVTKSHPVFLDVVESLHAVGICPLALSTKDDVFELQQGR